MKLNHIKLNDIDVNFDFTLDTLGYWDGYWERSNGIGRGGADPDSHSPMLMTYQKLLWESKSLPNGERMSFTPRRQYLVWKDFWFSNDAIIASFIHIDRIDFVKRLMGELPDYRAWREDYIHRTNVIGGEMIFPAVKNSINQRRGCSHYIKDRWDLTMECIRRHYAGEAHPLEKCFNAPLSKKFFDLFIDFRGFVDFFFLQDCVSEDYSNVILWYDTELFVKNPVPTDIEPYLEMISKELDFVEKRNKRIEAYIKSLVESGNS